jgi:hypothetical protein
MKQMRLSTLVIGLLALAVLVSPAAARQRFALEKDVVVAAGETQDNVFTLGGTVVVDGRVKQSIVAVGGTITISGEVGDSVVGIGARVLLKSSAAVRGDVVTLGGSLEKEPGATVGGDTVYFRASDINDKFLKNGLLAGLVSFSFVPFFFVFKLITFCLWLLAGLIVAGIFPRPVAKAAEVVRTSFWPVMGIGLLTIALFTTLVIFAALLSLVLIGIPILIVLVWAGFVIKLFGRVVLFYFFGESLLRAVRSRRITALGAVLLGVVVVSVAGLVPILGFLFLVALNVAGWGVAIRTKFGTTENMFRPKSGT